MVRAIESGGATARRSAQGYERKREAIEGVVGNPNEWNAAQKWKGL